MKLKEYASGFGWFGFAATAALVAFGTLAIRSAGGAREAVFHGMWIANLRTAAFAFVCWVVALSCTMALPTGLLDTVRPLNVTSWA